VSSDDGQARVSRRSLFRGAPLVGLTAFAGAGSVAGLAALTGPVAFAREDRAGMFIGLIGEPSRTAADCVLAGGLTRVSVQMAPTGTVVVSPDGRTGDLGDFPSGSAIAALPAAGTVEGAEARGRLVAQLVVPCVLGTQPPPDARRR
jgi:hypothetical protein